MREEGSLLYSLEKRSILGIIRKRTGKIDKGFERGVYPLVMDEETRKRLEELHRQLENVLRMDPKGFVTGEMSIRQEELHKIGFEKMRLNLDGCYWDLLRVPV